jgi:hypothetical protein
MAESIELPFDTSYLLIMYFCISFKLLKFVHQQQKLHTILIYLE